MKKLLLLLFAWFLIGCSSNSNNESEEVEEKEWVLSEKSVMGYDSLTKNYEFVGEWRMDIKMGTVNETLYYEYYNSVDENLCYLMIKDGAMSIEEKKRDGNKYWGINKNEYFVITKNGELICYGGEGELQDKELLKSYGITFTKLR